MGVGVAALLAAVCLAPAVAARTCRPVPGKVCSCALENGTEISLDAISGSASPVFSDVMEVNHSAADGRDYRYFYDPCRSFVLPQSGRACHGVSVCQQDRTATPDAYYNLGQLDHSSFGWNATQHTFYVSYQGANGHDWRTTNVTLNCSWSMPKDEHKLEVLPQDPSLRFDYKMTLTSLCACPGGCPPERPMTSGLTSGGVFLVLLFSAAAAYLVIGALYRRMIVGATGWEVIPNRRFWASLPGLVRDGVTYCITCRRVNDPDGYDQI